MKKLISLLLFVNIYSLPFAQSKNIFPSLNEVQKQKLLSTKIAIPLPTWIPDGFAVTNIITKTCIHAEF